MSKDLIVQNVITRLSLKPTEREAFDQLMKWSFVENFLDEPTPATEAMCLFSDLVRKVGNPRRHVRIAGNPTEQLLKGIIQFSKRKGQLPTAIEMIQTPGIAQAAVKVFSDLKIDPSPHAVAMRRHAKTWNKALDFVS